MYHLPRGASVRDAQAAAGLSYIEWRFFRNVAKTLAEECVQAHPSQPYAAYTPNQQKDITNAINAKLAQENIHAVGEDVIAWKMHAVIRDVIRAREKGKEQNQASLTASSQPIATDEPAQAATATRHFDPVRDI